MKDTTAAAIGLFAAWAIHDAEEVATMAPESKRILSRLPGRSRRFRRLRKHGLSQAHVNLSVGLMGGVVAAASIRGIATEGKSAFFRGSVLAFGIHGIGHIAGSIVARRYTTGVATVPLVVIPYWLWARKVLQRHKLRDDDAVASRVAYAGIPVLWAVHGITALILGARSIGGR